MLRELIDWWLQLKGFELILWGIALLFSILFLIQTIFSVFIAGHYDYHHFDDVGDHGHGDASKFFTIRNMIVFFTMFGWSGLAAYKSGLPNAAVVLIAVASGTLTVVLLYFIMTRANRLKHSGTLQTKNAINQIGETYLRIPAKRSGMGKVQITVQGRLVELDAMTDDADDIATGRPIKVTSTLNERILIVTSQILAN